jgi:hypothetical protein
MRINSVGAAGRAAFYDRNPLVKGLGDQTNTGALAPHAGTARYSYTVPTARKFLVGYFDNRFTRETVATTGGIYLTFLSYTPSGGSIVQMFRQEGNLNTVQAVGGGQFGSGTMLNAGDLISGSDTDPSTGGLISFNESCMGTEFDA